MQEGDPDIGAFCCVASLPAQGRLLDSLSHSLSRLFRPASANNKASSSSAPSAAAAAAGARPTTATTHTTHAASSSTLSSIIDDAVANWSSASPHGSVERAAFAHAALAVHQQVSDCLHLLPTSSAAVLPTPLPTTTLARVVPYTLFAPNAFVAVKGSISNTDELTRRFAARSGNGGHGNPSSYIPSSSPLPPPPLFLRSARSAPLPSFQAARDAALADEVACLSLTPPGSGVGGALLAGVRRAVDAGEATARAVLSLFEDAVAGAGARAADWPAQALTLALADVQGEFALVLHDAARGCTLAARDASGEEPLLFCLPPDGGAVVFASRPFDLPSARVVGAGDGGGAESNNSSHEWHEVPAGHFVVIGGGMGRTPRLHQFALTRQELRARADAAVQQDEGDKHTAGRARSGVALSSYCHHHPPVSPHLSAADSYDGSGGPPTTTTTARWSSCGGEDFVYD
jgi:hypothetical protein